MLEEHNLEIYVDSSISKNNGGLAGKIIFIDEDGDEKSILFQSTGYLNVKSTQMEIIACTYALEEVSRQQLDINKRNIVIFTDAKYVSEKYKEAMFHWVGNQWYMKSGKPVSHAKEWKELVKQLRKYYQRKVIVEIEWVKGHHKNPHNNFVDDLAKRASRLPIPLLPKNKTVSTYMPKEIVTFSKSDFGSVKMNGQEISIKILSCERLRLQRIWSYKYKVISTEDVAFGKVDKIYSKHTLETGKSYAVKFNLNTSNPRIEEVYREII